MQVATILSDLKSLSVCGHEEAFNLVNVYRSTSRSIGDAPGQSDPKGTPTTSDGKSDLRRDPDLQRAKDLVELHYEVKLKYMEEGLDADLQKARDEVMRIHKTVPSKKYG